MSIRLIPLRSRDSDQVLSSVPRGTTETTGSSGRGASLRQVVQHLRTGAIEVLGVAAPSCRPGHLLIVTRRSLISGTERMLVEFDRANLLQKARSQPESDLQ